MTPIEREPITVLKNVGPKRAALYQKLEIETLYDLLSFYPRSYIDYTAPKMTEECKDGQTVVLAGTVLRKSPPAYVRKGMTIYRLLANDGVHDFTVTIFNSEYLFKSIELYAEYRFCGRVTVNGKGVQMSLTSVVPEAQGNELHPLYSLTEGLSQGVLLRNIEEAFLRCKGQISDPLPAALREQHRLIGREQALWQIHFPKSYAEREQARERLAFEELFLFSLALMKMQDHERRPTGVRIQKTDFTPFLGSLPFTLTNAQRRAIEEIGTDLTGEVPMNRLLQGDVGSGKTMVAAAACFASAKSGYQSALMAPTEILASQHAATLKKTLEPLGIRCCLLTGSMTAKEKETRKAEIAAGMWDVIVGTHALVQQSTSFSKLGLVITDEQHRFGVRQRQTLAEKGERPHLLVMSATPIPRTLALLVYGDLALSVLDELPAGRKPVETFAVHSDKRARALGYVKQFLDRGRQGYIICPLVEEGELELIAATQYQEKLAKEFFPEYRVGLLHGRMKPQEKDEVMADFAAGKIHLLVATTVVEVGVDVPNADVMLIENAERFGLSQLHQLRGRIGRGGGKASCILVSDNEGEENRRRLEIMKSTNDGFVIAREDLKLRGAGDFFGTRQHGLPTLGVADLAEDSVLFAKVQGAARALLASDPTLSDPVHAELRAIIEENFVNNDSGRN